MNSKQWVKVQVVKSSMTIKLTKKIYNTKSEGLQMMGSKPHNYQILNKKGIDSLLSQGYKMFGEVETPKVVDLTGNPETEEAIRLYYNKKKEQRGVDFVVGKRESDLQSLLAQSQISHSNYQAKRSAENALSMANSYKTATEKHYKSRRDV